MNEEQTKAFEQIFGGLFNPRPQPAPVPEPAPEPKTVRTGYFCNKCDSDLHSMFVMTEPERSGRSLFYCINKQCKRFGLITVVAKLEKIE